MLVLDDVDDGGFAALECSSDGGDQLVGVLDAFSVGADEPGEWVEIP